MHPRAPALLLALALSVAPALSPAQTLRRASDAVHTGSSDRSQSNTSNNSSPRSYSSSSSSPSSSNLWYRSRRFLPFPYAWGYGGYGGYPMTEPVPFDGPPRSPRSVAVIASLDGGLGVPDLGRGGAGLRILGSSFEFELRYSVYAEPSAGQTLWAALGRYRGAFVLNDGDELRARFFGGVVHFLDDRGSEFGGEAGFGLDLFPGRPWVVSVDVSGGFVGQAGLVGARGTVGYLVGPVEFQIGWQHESLIPTVSGDAVHLSGPLAGVRLWR